MTSEEAFQMEKQRILTDRNIIAEENVRLLVELKVSINYELLPNMNNLNTL